MGDWKTAFAAQPSYETHAVQGEERRFYQLRAGTVFKLRPLAKPIGKILSGVFGSKDVDRALTERHVEDQGGTIRETIIGARDPETAKLQLARLDRLVDQTVDLLAQDEHKRLLVLLITDSMRDDFKATPDADEFLDIFSIGDVKDMLWGVAKANASVFGPFGKAAQAKLRQRLESMNDDTSAESPAPEAAEEGESPS